jgi:hypothetical protein
LCYCTVVDQCTESGLLSEAASDLNLGEAFGEFGDELICYPVLDVDAVGSDA